MTTEQIYGVACPDCGNAEHNEVVDSRPTKKGVRRRRLCSGCRVRFSTMESRISDTVAIEEEIANKAHLRDLRWNIPHEQGTIVVTTLFIKHSWDNRPPREYTATIEERLKEIEDVVAAYFGIGKRIRNKGLKEEFAYPRHIAMTLSGEITSYNKVAKYWKRHHTTVLNSAKRVKSDPELYKKFMELRGHLSQVLYLEPSR